MSRIVDVEQLGCLAWQDGEHGTTFDDGVLWVLEKIGELPAVQTCEDAVSRQAAIEILSLGKEILSRVLDDMDVVGTDREKYSWGLELIESNIKDIEELPSVQPQQWIPCSERLPTKRDWYLGIFKEPDTGWINPVPFICDYVGEETTATTKECWILKGCTDREEHIDYYFDLKCVAWMPLPKLYSNNM